MGQDFYKTPDCRIVFGTRAKRDDKGDTFPGWLSFYKNMGGITSMHGTIKCLMINIFNVKFVFIALTS